MCVCERGRGSRSVSNARRQPPLGYPTERKSVSESAGESESESESGGESESVIESERESE